MFQPDHFRGEVCLALRGTEKRGAVFRHQFRVPSANALFYFFPLPRYGPDARSVRPMSPSGVGQERTGRPAAGGAENSPRSDVRALCPVPGHTLPSPADAAERRLCRAGSANSSSSQSRKFSHPSPGSGARPARLVPEESVLYPRTELPQSNTRAPGFFSRGAGLRGRNDAECRQ
jgi:hypothetical protein